MFEQIAYAAETAAQPAGQAASPIALFFPFFIVFGIMYFLVWRPQQKQRKDTDKMIEELKKGDKIITAGGILGVVTSIQKDYVVMKVGDNDSTKMEVLKSAVTGLRE
ncbi:MAG TPA: preprotein translocase subunit YajC [Verrucomicrobiae bacterium]|nr:preprotein translocase subunit YajC [Verrucomicrobiae bacterium]